MDEIIDGNGKRHTRMGVFRPRSDLIGKSDEEIFRLFCDDIQSKNLIKLLRDANIVVRGGCGRNIDDLGYVAEGNENEVVVSLHGIAFFLSLALHLHYKKNIPDEDLKFLQPHKIQDTKQECLPDIYHFCLIFNSTNIPESYGGNSDDEVFKKIKITSPIWAMQERFSIPPFQLLSRCLSWFDSIPKLSEQYATPAEVQAAIENHYGISNTMDLASASFILYTAALNNNGIRPKTFMHMHGGDNHPSCQLMKKIALPVCEYKTLYFEEKFGLQLPIMYQTPFLVTNPVVEVAKDLWTIPIPRLILNRLVEGLYWGLFDVFLKKYKRADNIYTSWFGAVFERYVAEVMCASFKRKLKVEYVYSENDRSSDLYELHVDRTLLIETKARRPLLKSKIIYDLESFNKLKEFADEVIEQVFRFICKHCDDKQPLAFCSVKDYIVMVVTPETWPINPIIASGHADEKIKTLRDEKKNIRSVRIVFVSVADLELIPPLPGHHFAYDLVDKYLNSSFYPHSSLSDFIKLKLGLKQLQNSYVHTQAEKAMMFAKEAINTSSN